MSIPTDPVEIATGYAETGAQLAPTNPQLTAGKTIGSDVKIGVGLWNWLTFWLSNAVRFLLYVGLPNWNSGRQYAQGAIVRYSGKFYIARASAPTIAVTPDTNEFLSNRQWEEWFASTFGVPETMVTYYDMLTSRNNVGWLNSRTDRLGFRMGGPRSVELEEMWRGNEVQTGNGATTFVLTNMRWAVNVTAGGIGGLAQVQPPSGTWGTKYLQVEVGNHTGDSTLVYSPEAIGYFDTSVGQMALEFAILNGASVDKALFGIALCTGTGNYDPTSNLNGAAVFKADGNTNWHARTGDGTTLGTDTDSGVSCGAAVSTFFRIEYLAAAQSSNATAQVRIYVGGSGSNALVLTAHIPATNSASIVIFNKPSGAGGQVRDFYVSPIRFRSTF
jgi:hypothetical protein